MFTVLEPLHLRMEKGPETLKEISFNHVSSFISPSPSISSSECPPVPHAFILPPLTSTSSSPHLPPLLLPLLLPLLAFSHSSPTSSPLIPLSQAYGRDLAEAYDWCKKFQATNNVKDLTQAWELYYHVFRRISKQMPQVRGGEKEREEEEGWRKE